MTLPPYDLPPTAAAAFQGLSDEQKAAFVSRYQVARRSMPLMVALSILFPIQLFLLGRVLVGILFLLTAGGLGVWYVIEWFLTPGRVREYNAKVAGEILATIGRGATTSPEADQE